MSDCGAAHLRLGTENYRDDLLSDLEKNMKRMSDKEKLEAPAPQARTKQHQSPVVGKGKQPNSNSLPMIYFCCGRNDEGHWRTQHTRSRSI